MPLLKVVRPRLPVWKRTDRNDLPLIEILTPTQYRVATMVLQGLKNREIAAQLGTKEQVIKNYLHHIYERTNLRGKAELAARVRREAA